MQSFSAIQKAAQLFYRIFPEFETKLLLVKELYSNEGIPQNNIHPEVLEEA